MSEEIKIRMLRDPTTNSKTGIPTFIVTDQPAPSFKKVEQKHPSEIPNTTQQITDTAAPAKKGSITFTRVTPS